MSHVPPPTQPEVRAGPAAPEGVQDQQAHLEEKAVRADVETAHLVEAIAAHHQGDEAEASADRLHVVDDPVQRCSTAGERPERGQRVTAQYIHVFVAWILRAGR